MSEEVLTEMTAEESDQWKMVTFRKKADSSVENLVFVRFCRKCVPIGLKCMM